MKKLHIGCGKNYMKGWINTDINDNITKDKYLDASKHFPFKNNEIDYIYCEHFIEHLRLQIGVKCLKECKRVLKNNGIIRLSTPNLNSIVNRYVNKELIIVGRKKQKPWKPATLCDMVNEAMRLWGHQYIYDFEKLQQILKSVGFTKIIQCEYKKSEVDIFKNLESRPYHKELIVEAS